LDLRGTTFKGGGEEGEEGRGKGGRGKGRGFTPPSGQLWIRP